MNTQTLADRFFGFPLRCLVLALVLLALLVPIATRYRLRTPTLTAEQIETSRTVPADALLDQLAERQLMFHYGARGDKVAAAERVLRGEVDNSGRIFKIQFPFAPGDLETPRVEDQLFVGSLGVVRILLDGYQASGRPEFLRGAADVLVAFSRFERSAWSPKGRMWNDHALAEQLYVLTDFWRLYRRNPIYQPEVARVVLEQAARGARRLTRPSLFSYWGNHGVMQNLALWHVALAFPHLPGLKDNAPLAFERLQDVMRFYLNEEGVVLEHSSLYQAFGIEKLGHAFWYMHLARQPIPGEWIARYERAIAFYAQLRRPNRSLPTLGDTTRTTRLLPSLDSPSVRGIDVARIADHGSTVDLVDVRDWGRPQPASLHPVAGYATWWDGLSNWPDSAALAQTLVAWSYFPGHAHKHADELTVLFWAGGQDWWSNSGYWSTGDRRRSEAISWGGSNAPHLVGEPADSVRQTSLLGSATTENLAFLDLERCGPADFAARRQILKIQPNLWMVIDRVSGEGRHRTIWSTANQVQMDPGAIPRSYRLSSTASPPSLLAIPLGPKEMTLAEVRGSEQPFAGWQFVDGEPVGVPALLMEQPGPQGWSAMIWQLEGTNDNQFQLVDVPELTWGGDPTTWSVRLRAANATLEVKREGSTLSVLPGADARPLEPGRVTIATDFDVSDRVRQIRQDFVQVRGKYRADQLYVGHRRRLIASLALAFVIQECALFALGRRYILVRRYLPSLLVGLWVITLIGLSFFFASLVNLASRAL